MKRKVNFIIIILLISTSFSLFMPISHASSGVIRVHYADDTRKATFDYTKIYGNSIGYDVYGFNNATNYYVPTEMMASVAYVIHVHGDAGRLQMRDTFLVGKGGTGNNYKSINSFGSNSLSKMKIVLYYGCGTGQVSPTYGDICQETVNKGAQVAVSWTNLIVVNEVNEWNRLFFEKAKTDTIVESFRHADCWVRRNLGDAAGDRMQLYRNEKGNINGYVKP